MAGPVQPTTIEELQSAEAIRNLILWYNYCVDNGRIDDLVEVFTADGAWDSTDNDHGRYEGRETMRAFFGSFPDVREAFHHLVTGPLFLELGPDQARGICTYTSRILFNGKDDMVLEGGRYHDHYVRTPDGWRIKERVLEHTIPSRSAPRSWVDSATSIGNVLDH